MYKYNNLLIESIFLIFNSKFLKNILEKIIEQEILLNQF